MKIDACGLSCPQPVILTMNAMKKKETYLEISVDNNTACENIKRLADSKGYDMKVEKSGENFQLFLTEQTNRQ